MRVLDEVYARDRDEAEQSTHQAVAESFRINKCLITKWLKAEVWCIAIVDDQLTQGQIRRDSLSACRIRPQREHIGRFRSLERELLARWKERRKKYATIASCCLCKYFDLKGP